MSVEGTVEWTDHDLHAWQVLRPLLDAGPYLPWSSGAMRASGLVTLCNEIVFGRRRMVELGAGASTLLFARVLRDYGGTLVAVEHDARWASWVTDRLAAEGLSEVASVVFAPLEETPHGWDGLPWYAASPLAAAVGEEPIDLLLVDGPPAHDRTRRHARYPALPALIDALADDAVVVLDDAIRDGEGDVVERWERETPFRFARREREAIALGRVPA